MRPSKVGLVVSCASILAKVGLLHAQNDRQHSIRGSTMHEITSSRNMDRQDEDNIHNHHQSPKRRLGIDYNIHTLEKQCKAKSGAQHPRIGIFYLISNAAGPGGNE